MIRHYSASAREESFFASRSLPSPNITDILPGGLERYLQRAAARKYRGSFDSNVYNRIPPVYVMDAGVWAGGPDGKPQTSFGMISGRDIFLCSWSNFCEGGWSYSKVSKHEGPSIFTNGLSRGSKTFFETTSRYGRGFILSWARLPNKLGLFTSDDTVLVVLPDLHLHLQAGGPLDPLCLCNLMSGNSLEVCASIPTEGHAPRWGGPFFWYSMKEINRTWRTKHAERAEYGH